MATREERIVRFARLYAEPKNQERRDQTRRSRQERSSTDLSGALFDVLREGRDHECPLCEELGEMVDGTGGAVLDHIDRVLGEESSGG